MTREALRHGGKSMLTTGRRLLKKERILRRNYQALYLLSWITLRQNLLLSDIYLMCFS